MENKIRVLIVEDEMIIALDIKKRLLTLNYEVVGMAQTANDAIRQAEKTLPSIVLMDIILKGERDGIYAADHIRENFNIPVVFLTAHADLKTVDRAKYAEPYGYIYKPFEGKDLQTGIEIAIYKHDIEMKLKESELRYRTLVYTATDAVLTIDEDGIITSANSKTALMFGYQESQIMGMAIKSLLPDTFVNHLKQGLKRFLDIGKSIAGDVLELMAKRSDGSSFPVELSFSQWVTLQTKQSTLIIRDISKRKENEEELKRTQLELKRRIEERTLELKAIIDQSPLPMTIFYPDGDLLYINEAWIDFFNGVPLLFQEGNIIDDAVLKKFGLTQKLKEIFVNGGSFSSDPIYLDPSDFDMIKMKEGILFVIHFYAVLNEAGEVIRGVCFIKHSIKMVKAEEIHKELQVTKDISNLVLEKLENERARIAGELHDSFGQTLQAIKLNLEVFEKCNFSKPEFFDSAKKTLNNAGEELRNTIFFLHPQILDSFGLAASIELLVENIRERFGLKISLSINNRNIRLKKSIELVIHRIVQEALTNIVKHSKANFVDIKLYFDNERASGLIKDDGVGFNSEGSKQNKRSSGLIIMKERVTLLNGVINVEGKKNKGTEIEFEIPLKE